MAEYYVKRGDRWVSLASAIERKLYRANPATRASGPVQETTEIREMLGRLVEMLATNDVLTREQIQELVGCQELEQVP